MPPTSFKNVFSGCTSISGISFPTISSISTYSKHYDAIEASYEHIFNQLCMQNKDKYEEYMSLWKLYGNYRQTVLAIEAGDK